MDKQKILDLNKRDNEGLDEREINIKVQSFHKASLTVICLCVILSLVSLLKGQTFYQYSVILFGFLGTQSFYQYKQTHQTIEFIQTGVCLFACLIGFIGFIILG